MNLSRPVSSNFSLPDDVNRLIGEIITNYALAENLVNGMLPERCRGKRPEFAQDIVKLEQIVGRLDSPLGCVVQPIIELVRELAPVRHNLVHGHMNLRTSVDIAIAIDETEGNSSGTRLPPEMVRPHVQDETGKTELSREALEPYASKCMQLVFMIHPRAEMLAHELNKRRSPP